MYGKIHPALWALTISAFAIGTTEFVIVGLVPVLAHDLKVSMASAGSLVSVYAMGVAIGAPVLTALTSKMKRKPLMISLMLLFIGGHLASAFSPDYQLLLLSRFITGFAHGVFFGVGATIAASLVTADKRASAIALMFSGFTIATIIGVPLGTYIGQHWGWRATFVGVALLGCIGLAGVTALLPSSIGHNVPGNLFKQCRILLNKRFLMALLMTIFGYGGVFVAFTYMSPMLQQITGFSANAVNLFLLLYGLAVALGNLVGGKVANKNPFTAPPGTRHSFYTGSTFVCYSSSQPTIDCAGCRTGFARGFRFCFFGKYIRFQYRYCAGSLDRWLCGYLQPGAGLYAGRRGIFCCRCFVLLPAV
jgi:DHA1 family inner membrane transport protein